VSFKKVTESESLYHQLEKKSVHELLQLMNEEDQKVPIAVRACTHQIEAFIQYLIPQMKLGGRLFFIGAGTSGRLGVIDASECPPTFGIPDDWIIGIIAGGDGAIRKAVEFAEDHINQAWIDLTEYQIESLDTVVGIAASGTTPYVIHGLKKCQENKITTACITCNPNSPITEFSDFKIECEVGPEFVTGSTRLKSGTAQKLILNMITTCTMIGLGRVVDNKMVDMQLTNDKLIDRGVKMILKHRNMDYEAAKHLLLQSGSVRKAIHALHEIE
jgi:N-acetylmuramic acid 6-phosphate etherase